MSVLSDWECEMHIFGVFARAALHGRDRSVASSVPVHHDTGLPLSANDILPRAHALVGEGLALQIYVIPDQLAAGLLRHEVVEGEARKLVALSSIARAEWSDREAEWHQALARQIKVTVHRLKEHGGYFVLEPPGGNPYEQDLLCLGKDGLTQAFMVTHKGLKEALRRVKGTRFEHAPQSMAADVPDSVWREAPQWARTEERLA